MAETPVIVKIEDSEEKGRIVAAVLADLPQWFGLPEATAAYIEDSKKLPLWAAKLAEEAIGFVTLRESSPETGELHCMGVKRAHHRQGVGKGLYAALEDYARARYRFLQVKTVALGHYTQYDQTIAFYRRMGFSELEVFPTLWDEWNPCLVMVKALGPAGPRQNAPKEGRE